MIPPASRPAGVEAARTENFAACYEQLRERLRGQPAQSAEFSIRGLALATLLESGLPGWLQMIAPTVDATPSAANRVDTADAPAKCGPAFPALPRTNSLATPASEQEIAMLLANLVLSRKRPADRSDRLLAHGGTRC